MIGFLKGKIFKIAEHSLLLDVSGVGYEVFMPSLELSALLENEDLLVYTYHHQKEDMVALFGFRKEETKRLFELLTSVSGLGPKTTLGILSHINEEDLISAIVSGDTTTLVKIPGIGNKTAGRVVLELQDKLESTYGNMGNTKDQLLCLSDTSIIADAESALTFLGYGKKEISEALRKLIKKNKDYTLDGLIRDALKELGK
ncbi:MAG: holliday junction DNA helicase ruva [Fusobacteria bacterium]|nr:MAG: holliday junction DNA helicase ruva [Fusobacteriota bacterium]KAF0229614.1 MAG: holliday junction DNA helicase [Fusobacteriota bacterium]